MGGWKMSKTYPDISFSDLLPSSIASDPTIAAAAEALDAELQAVNDAIQNIAIYSQVDLSSDALLKHLAWQWHVDFWDDTLDSDAKLTLVLQSYDWHRHKGTPYAVEQMVQDVLGGGSVQEWFEYGGDPFHFKIISNSPPQDLATYDRLLAAVKVSKNERSILDDIESSMSINSDVYFTGILAVGAINTIEDEGVWNG
jgi:phage tail P2-like protein